MIIQITECELEDIGQGRDTQKKLVLGIKGNKKKLVLNKTNAKTIEKVLGTDETNEWIDQKVTLQPREVEFQGDMIMSIRVSLKKPGAADKTTVPAESDDSEIPFN